MGERGRGVGGPTKFGVLAVQGQMWRCKTARPCCEQPRANACS